MFGIDPVNDVTSARLNGIYPLTLPTAGYDAIEYYKDGNTYGSVDAPFSRAELEALDKLKAIDADAATVVDDYIADWSSSTTYAQDDIVEYDGRIWKAKRASTNVAPNSYVFPNVDPLESDPDWELIYQ